MLLDNPETKRHCSNSIEKIGIIKINKFMYVLMNIIRNIYLFTYAMYMYIRQACKLVKHLYCVLNCCNKPI